MGYQESIITTEKKRDFEKFLKIIREDYGKEYYKDRWCDIPFIAEFKKNVPYLEITEGTKFIYFTGERSQQRGSEEFFDTKIGNMNPFELRIIFRDYLPYEFFDEEGHLPKKHRDKNDLVKFKDFKWR